MLISREIWRNLLLLNRLKNDLKNTKNKNFHHNLFTNGSYTVFIVNETYMEEGSFNYV